MSTTRMAFDPGARYRLCILSVNSTRPSRNIRPGDSIMYPFAAGQATMG